MSSFRFPSILILFYLISLSVSAQNIALTNAVSYENHDESISLGINPSSGYVSLVFMFTNVSFPLDISDFENEPSFTNITVSCTHSPDSNNTLVNVGLNTAIVSISQGKLKADLIKVKFENFFGVSLPYRVNFTDGNTVYYSYNIAECPSIQKFREVLLECKPSEGFGKVITPTLIGNYVQITFDLTINPLIWQLGVGVSNPNNFQYGLDKEFTVSLKALTGYSGTIQSSPESSQSTLSIHISQVAGQYKLTSLETTPSQMVETQNTYTGGSTFTFIKTITGSSVDDLSIHFKIVSPNYIDPTTIAMYVGIVVVVVAILSIVVFIIKREKKD